MNRNKPNHFIILGTDTHVGKTVISLLLIQYLYKLGFQPGYLKPLQTGCQSPIDSDSDAQFVFQHSYLKEKNPAQSVLYCFQSPKAPWFAARDENTEIHVQDLTHRIQVRLNDHQQPMVIEASGGLMVPISPNVLFIDLLSKLNALPILVGRAGLGTINHSLLSIHMLLSRNIIPAGIILSNASSVDKIMVKENVEAVDQFSKIPVRVLDKIDDFYAIPDSCIQLFEGIVNGVKEKRMSLFK